MMSLHGHDSIKSEHLIEWCSRALSTDLHGIWTSREDDFVILPPLVTVSRRILAPQHQQLLLSVAFLAQSAFCSFCFAASRFRDKKAG